MSKTIKSLIVDDEMLARESLAETLSGFPEIEIIGECCNGFEAIRMIQDNNPDLVFLDIQMPKLDGFDVIELLGDNLPYIIFVTAYDEFALKAFETQALDYLLKPVQKKRLQKSIEKLKTRMSFSEKEKIKKLIDLNVDRISPISRVLIRDGNNVTIIKTNEIVYIQAYGDYIKIHTENKTYIKYDRMNNIENRLDSKTFCRIHRSYIINIDYLAKIEPYTKDSKIVKLTNSETLPLSRRGNDRLMELL